MIKAVYTWCQCHVVSVTERKPGHPAGFDGCSSYTTGPVKPEGKYKKVKCSAFCRSRVFSIQVSFSDWKLLNATTVAVYTCGWCVSVTECKRGYFVRFDCWGESNTSAVKRRGKYEEKKTCCWLWYVYVMYCCLHISAALHTFYVCKLFITLLLLFTAVLIIHIIVAESVQPCTETTNGLQPASAEGVGSHVARMRPFLGWSVTFRFQGKHCVNVCLFVCFNDQCYFHASTACFYCILS